MILPCRIAVRLEHCPKPTPRLLGSCPLDLSPCCPWCAMLSMCASPWAWNQCSACRSHLCGPSPCWAESTSTMWGTMLSIRASTSCKDLLRQRKPDTRSQMSRWSHEVTVRARRLWHPLSWSFSSEGLGQRERDWELFDDTRGLFLWRKKGRHCDHLRPASGVSICFSRDLPWT